MQEDPAEGWTPEGGRDALRITAPVPLDGPMPALLMASSYSLCKAVPSLTSLRLPTARHHIPIPQKITIMRTIAIMAISGAPIYARQQAKSLLMSSHSTVSNILQEETPNSASFPTSTRGLRATPAASVKILAVQRRTWAQRESWPARGPARAGVAENPGLRTPRGACLPLGTGHRLWDVLGRWEL